VSAVSWLLVQAVGWALLHFIWKGALIGIATALSLKPLHRASSQSRYVLLCLALLACLSVPLLDVYRYMAAALPVLGEPAAPAVLTVLAQRLDTQSLQPHVLLWVVALWMLGMIVMTSRLATGLVWVHQMRAVGLGRSDDQWQRCVSRLATQCGISRKITLRVAASLSGPLTVGWWRPVIVVPVALLTQMPPDLLEALLAHEVAHIRRVDYLVNLLQRMIETLLFYHPVVWWLSRRIRIERELVADNVAARLIQEPRRLALALEQLSLFQASDVATVPFAQWAKGGLLLDRIKRLSQPATPPNRKVSILTIALSLAVFCLATHVLGSMPASTWSVDTATDQNIQPFVGTLESNHVMVVDDRSGNVLLQKGPDDIVPIASLTKLMTAMVVLDARPDMNQTIRIGQADAEALLGTRTGLPAGANLPLREVLQLALMSSNNSAAYALAQNYPGGLAAFRTAVRAKITALGLQHTTIDEPTGLSPLNTSTASDVMLMANAAARYPAIARYTTYSSDIVVINGKPVEYRNTNPFVGQRGWDIALSKTGFTNEAGRCLIMRLRSVGKNVTMVLLDAGDAASPARDAINIRRMLLGRSA
jgi:D-alanyl-D-alanine endopeptidase (penicillin-binding protein 7)